MNSCNTIRSVELLYYYYYWCTYILARYRKCIVILLPKSLVVSFVLLNLFGLYFMFFLFFIRFNFPTTFFKRRLLKFIIFFRCEKILFNRCSCKRETQLHISYIWLLCKKSHSSISWDIFDCVFVYSIIPLFNVSLNS